MGDHAQPTARQLQVLRLIAKGIDRGLPPTNRELCVSLGVVSTNSMADHMRALIKKGYLDKVPRRARALRLTPRGRHVLDLELARRVLARRGAA